MPLDHDYTDFDPDLGKGDNLRFPNWAERAKSVHWGRAIGLGGGIVLGAIAISCFLGALERNDQRESPPQVPLETLSARLARRPTGLLVEHKGSVIRPHFFETVGCATYFESQTNGTKRFKLTPPPAEGKTNSDFAVYFDYRPRDSGGAPAQNSSSGQALDQAASPVNPFVLGEGATQALVRVMFSYSSDRTKRSFPQTLTNSAGTNGVVLQAIYVSKEE